MVSAPFPWFGGKRKVAADVWARFGRVYNYVEPFFGSGAVLLGRPTPFDGNETINDLDGFVANFWRAMRHAPAETAEWSDNPVNENDLHARHVWLMGTRDGLRTSLEGNPEWCDPKIAGWWVWGLCSWIGGGWCSGRGPWRAVDGQLLRIEEGTSGRGVNRKLPNLGDNGRGVNRALPNLGNNGVGVNRQLPNLGDNGRGVNRKLPHLGNNGVGVNSGASVGLSAWFHALSERMSRVRVCSGDWSRVCGPSVTFKHGRTAVFLDPPYADTAERTMGLYAEDSASVAHDVREWAIEAGDRPDMLIALCGYEGEHVMPQSWAVHEWNAGACLGGHSENGRRERIWFSPACGGKAQMSLL